MLQIDSKYKSQVFTVNIQPNGNAQTIRVALDYRPYVGKYFASVSNADTGEEILTNFPIVASMEYGLNDLLKQVCYKLCGTLICYPLLKRTTYEDPNGTIEEYELVWGDSFWIE